MVPLPCRAKTQNGQNTDRQNAVLQKHFISLEPFRSPLFGRSVFCQDRVLDFLVLPFALQNYKKTIWAPQIKKSLKYAPETE